MAGRIDKSVCMLIAAILTGACAPLPEARHDSGEQVRVAADEPVNPRRVRFDVPTAMLMGIPGQYELPMTGQARIATQAIASEALAARGYCPHGFTGPEGIRFSEDRSRGVFVVSCRG